MKASGGFLGDGFCAGRVAAVARHELRLLFYSPLTCIFVAGLLTVLSLCVFLVADFYTTDEASMRVWRIFIPWVGLIFMPALAMRSWPDAYTDGSVELAMTLPINAAELVSGKFAAGLVVIMVALVFTLPFPLTLAYLGEPDWGVVCSTLLAAFLLLALYFAISICIAAIVGDPVSVFVVSVLTLFLVTMFGSSEFDALLDGIAAPWLLQLIDMLGPRSHFDVICSGLLRFFDIGYFLLGMALALVLCATIVEARRAGPLRRSVGRIMRTGLLAAVVFAAIQATVSVIPVDLDLTEQKEFTLDHATIDRLARTPAQTRVRLFWSAAQGNVPVAIQSHAGRVRNLLHRIARHSAGKIQIEEIDPLPDTDAELLAIEAGMQSVPMSSGDYFYLGVAIQYQQRTRVLPYIDIQREHFLEYDLIAAISQVSQTRINRVALLSPLLPPGSLRQPRPGLSFVEELKRSYDVALVPFFDEQLPPDIDVLIVVQSAILKQNMLRAIDRFVVAGGALIVIMDAYVRADRTSNEVEFQPSAEINDISDLVLSYGLRYIGDRVVGDHNLASSVAVGEDSSRIGFPYWMRFGQAQIASEFAGTASLTNLLLAEPGAFEVTDNVDADTVIRPLLSTTENSGSESRQVYITQTPAELARNFQPDGKNRMVAALISGRIESAFADAGADGTAAGAKVFAIADADWLFDQFAMQTSELGGQVMTRPINDNLALLGNMIAFATDGELSTIQARGRMSRPFSRVERLFRQTQQEIRASERSTWQNVAALERQLDEIRAAAGVDDLSSLPLPMQQQVISLQSELVAMRRDLRNIRLQIRRRVDQLGIRLTVINILSGPLLVMLLAVFISRRRDSL